jgi:2Fe-2S ferredoxin
MTYTITFLDQDTSFSIDEEKTVLEALLDEGIDYMHACGGFCNCTTCAVRVEEGASNLSEMTRDERNTLKRFQGDEALEGPFRLSCQAKIQGDISISQPDWY